MDAIACAHIAGGKRAVASSNDRETFVCAGTLEALQFERNTRKGQAA